MRIATWNVNSLKARLARVEEWLAQAQPDVLCMQETKLADDAFPALAFEALGYEIGPPRRGSLERRGHRQPGRPRRRGRRLRRRRRARPRRPADLGDLRRRAGGAASTCPTVASLDDDHYQYKLRWLERLRGVLDRHDDPSRDAGRSAATSTSPPTTATSGTRPSSSTSPTSAQPERDALARLEDWGLVDVFRQRYDDGGLFSWWDYRAGNFHKGKGMRIDLIAGHRVAGGPVDRAT